MQQPEPSKPYVPRATGASLQPAQELRSSRPAGMQLEVPVHDIALGKPHCQRVYSEKLQSRSAISCRPRTHRSLRRRHWKSRVAHVGTPSEADQTEPSSAKVAQVAKEEMEHATKLADTNPSTKTHIHIDTNVYLYKENALCISQYFAWSRWDSYRPH